MSNYGSKRTVLQPVRYRVPQVSVLRPLLKDDFSNFLIIKLREKLSLNT